MPVSEETLDKVKQEAEFFSWCFLWAALVVFVLILSPAGLLLQSASSLARSIDSNKVKPALARLREERKK